jgi:hypothetical protein
MPFLRLAQQTAKLAQMAHVFALAAPSDVLKLSLQSQGRSRRKRSRAVLLSPASSSL